MDWSFHSVLNLALSLFAVTFSFSATGYPIPIDFSGKLLRWAQPRTDPNVTYNIVVDNEADLVELAGAVEYSADLWSSIEGSYLQLVRVETGGMVTVHLKRNIDGGEFSSGYTEFDKLQNDGSPQHCSTYILIDSGLYYDSVAKTILHEFGHCLGLGHSLIPQAIMSYSLEKNSYALDVDDEAAMSRLYPANGHLPEVPPGCAIGSTGYRRNKSQIPFFFILITPAVLIALHLRRKKE